MPVRLNIVKTSVTPQIRRTANKTALRTNGLLVLTTENARKLKDYGHPDPNPNADPENEDHMAKTTLGGMAAGATTGAAIGSAVPVVGTLIGALAGGVVGAIGGAFAGLFTGKK